METGLKTLNAKVKSNTKIFQFNLKNFRKLIVFAHPQYFHLLIGIVFGMISSGVQLLIPILAQFLINSFKHHIDYWLIVGIVGMLVVTAILSAASGTILGIFGENVVANLRKELWKKVINLPVKYFDLVKSGI